MGEADLAMFARNNKWSPAIGAQYALLAADALKRVAYVRPVGQSRRKSKAKVIHDSQHFCVLSHDEMALLGYADQMQAFVKIFEDYEVAAGMYAPPNPDKHGETCCSVVLVIDKRSKTLTAISGKEVPKSGLHCSEMILPLFRALGGGE